MSKVMKRRWESEHQGGLARQDRRSCEYEVYIPDRLVGRSFTLEGSVAADVTDAETAIARLNLEARSLSNSEALARLLLRSESVASSKIEGLEVGARRLLKAEAARELGRFEEAATLLHDAMCAAYEMDPPLEAEVGVGDDWVAAKS